MRAYIESVLVALAFMTLQILMGDDPHLLLWTVLCLLVGTMLSFWIVDRISNTSGRRWNPKSELHMAIYFAVFFLIMLTGDRLISDRYRPLTVVVCFAAFTAAQTISMLLFGKTPTNNVQETPIDGKVPK